MKQTAVEWLQDRYDNCPESFLTKEDFEYAKALERKQFIEFTEDYLNYYFKETLSDSINPTMTPEQYYNEIYATRN